MTALRAQPPGMRGRALNIALLVACGMSWSLVFSLAKIAASSGYSPLGLTFWQGVGGGVLLLAISAWRRRRLPLAPRYLGFYLVCGILGTALPTCLMFVAVPHVGAGILAIIMALVPLLTYGGSIATGIDRPTALRVTGIALGFAAVLLIVLPEAGIDGSSTVAWLALALAIPVSYTAENMVLALRRPGHVDAITLVGGFQICGALVLLPVTLATGTFVDLAGPWGGPEWAAVAMFVCNAASYSLFLVVMQRAGPVFAAQSAYIITVAGVLWGMALFGERHGPWVWGALALMLAGMALVQEHRVARSGVSPRPASAPRPPPRRRLR